MGRYTVEILVADWEDSLQLLKGPGLITASPLNISKRLQRHARIRATGNRKNGTQNFVVIFKTLPSDRNKTKKSIMLMRSS